MIQQPDWRKGDVIVAREGLGMGRVPFVADIDPHEEHGRWLYGLADATKYRLATHEDVKTALMDFYERIGREREWMRAVIDMIPCVREMETQEAKA